jgi:hypothetical protein
MRIGGAAIIIIIMWDAVKSVPDLSALALERQQLAHH